MSAKKKNKAGNRTESNDKKVVGRQFSQVRKTGLSHEVTFEKTTE